jgi:hypothetical protein
MNVSASAVTVTVSLTSITEATGNVRDLAMRYEPDVMGVKSMRSGNVLLKRVLVRESHEQHEFKFFF